MKANYPMNTLHKRFDEWMKENPKKKANDDQGESMTDRIFKVIVWYEETTGNRITRMKRGNISSVEIMALRGILEILQEYGAAYTYSMHGF